MHDRVIYEFAIIRFVPKVEREEFVNVGAILYAKRQKFLKMQFFVNKDKLAAFAPDADLELLTEYLEAWAKICAGDLSGGVIGTLEQADRFRWIGATKSTLLQCSKIHPGLCHDPETELKLLFEKFVK